MFHFESNFSIFFLFESICLSKANKPFVQNI